MKSLSIFSPQASVHWSLNLGWISGNVSRKEGCLQNIICCAVQHAAIQDTVSLWRGLQGLHNGLSPDRTGELFFSHFHRFWCLSMWKVLSAISSQIHHGGCCYSGLGLEEVSGSFISTGIAAKLMKMIKKMIYFLHILQVSSAEIWHSITLQPSIPAELENKKSLRWP